ncbi:SDR family oxidoreductase [Tundrisphaera lichenicola]|uniref:SDR family oxidoreductase n=1 Tax=Tundrisphaera lichenicola TaxID=2029860 RepID=UPI003EB826E6
MKILLTGASGQLGAYLLEQLIADGHKVEAWSLRAREDRCGVKFRPIDLTDADATERALRQTAPQAIIHAAALSSAEAVRADPAGANTINVEATRRIAEWSMKNGRRLVFTSTDLVFDGSRPWSREDDPAIPLLIYGQTKKDAENAVLQGATGVVARLSLLFGPSRSGRPYFFDRAIQEIREGIPRTFFDDEFRTPLDLSTAARILIELMTSDLSGLFHVAGAERVSRFELMRRASMALGLNTELVKANRRSDQFSSHPRPADVSLDTSKLLSVFPNLIRPSIEEAIRGR